MWAENRAIAGSAIGTLDGPLVGSQVTRNHCIILPDLLWRALDRGPAETEVGEELRGRTIAGAVRSGFAEYWDGDSAAGGGATPQSWTGLALVLAKTRTTSPSSSG